MSHLIDIQKRIADEYEKRGFVKDPVKIVVLLSEEVGEIAKEIRRFWSKNHDEFSVDRLKEEISDTFFRLVALANQFDVDIEEAVKEKFFETPVTQQREQKLS